MHRQTRLWDVIEDKARVLQGISVNDNFRLLTFPSHGATFRGHLRDCTWDFIGFIEQLKLTRTQRPANFIRDLPIRAESQNGNISCVRETREELVIISWPTIIPCYQIIYLIKCWLVLKYGQCFWSTKSRNFPYSLLVRTSLLVITTCKCWKFISNQTFLLKVENSHIVYRLGHLR